MTSWRAARGARGSRGSREGLDSRRVLPAPTIRPVARRERDVLERAVQAVAEQASKTNTVIDEAMEAGLAADHPVAIAAKQVRLELLNMKADLERELGKLVLNCTACGQEVHWVQGISMSDPGHWGHRLPAPHGEPMVS